MTEAQIGEFALRYQVAGSGPGIVFLHGLSYDRRIWQPVVELLSPDYTCVAIDLPGHGESPDADSYDLDSIVHLIKDILHILQIEDPTVVGNSMGAWMASIYAARYGARAVILVDQTVQLALTARYLQLIESQLRGIEFPEACRAFEDAFRVAHLPEENRRILRESSRQRQEIMLKYWEPLLTAAEPEELDRRFRPTLEAVICPVLSLHGSDPGKDYAEWLSERMAHAKVEVWEGAGHFPQLMDPERFADAVRQTATQAKKTPHISDS